MSFVFDKGNAELNSFVNQLISVQENDHILEIGFGTGKLIYQMANQVDKGLIEGVDFSATMVSKAQKKNRKHIANGKVKIQHGDFDQMSYEKASLDKVCSTNTLYFWPEPEHTAKKVADILKPDGKFLVAFEDIAQLEKKGLSEEVFRLYSKDDVRELLMHSGFSGGVRIESREIGSSIYHCAVATK
jgi:ubiquinone/menaquinone biosynthesis C-methylase UbiE